MNGTITHIAAEAITFSGTGSARIMRQRCSWCGALLLEVNVNPVVVCQVYEVHALVRADGSFLTSLDVELLPSGDIDIPQDSCMWIDPFVTA